LVKDYTAYFLKHIQKKFGALVVKIFLQIGAAQRIKGLSLSSAIKNAFIKPKKYR
jgi:hypothetical protein